MQLGLAGVALYAARHAAAQAEEHAAPAAPSGLQLQREGDQLLLSSHLTWTLPEPVAEALHSGVPVYFIVQAQLQRKRWWWSDETLAQVQRYWRLSYQPLTRRWRLHQGSAPLGSSHLGVGTSYTDVREALAVLQRVVRWPIAEAAVLPREGELQVQLQVRLDLSQFPRPLQIGAMGRSDWSELAQQTQRVWAESL